MRAIPPLPVKPSRKSWKVPRLVDGQRAIVAYAVSAIHVVVDRAESSLAISGIQVSSRMTSAAVSPVGGGCVGFFGAIATTRFEPRSPQYLCPRPDLSAIWWLIWSYLGPGGHGWGVPTGGRASQRDKFPVPDHAAAAAVPRRSSRTRVAGCGGRPGTTEARRGSTTMPRKCRLRWTSSLRA